MVRFSMLWVRTTLPLATLPIPPCERPSMQTGSPFYRLERRLRSGARRPRCRRHMFTRIRWRDNIVCRANWLQTSVIREPKSGSWYAWLTKTFFFSGSGTFSNILFPTPDTTAGYDALIARLNRRFASGFQFDAIYRFSKSKDIVSYDGPTANTNPTYPLDVREERGPSDFDVRHHFVASGLWELPIFRNRHDGIGNILGGWQLSGIVTAHTGISWTPVIESASAHAARVSRPVRPTAYFGGAGTDSSNDAFITGSNFPGGGSAFFSTAAPVGFQLPGIGRNSVPRPAIL